MAASAPFDAVRLRVLEQQVPPTLRILRLRLRFGLPRALGLGQRFRIMLELVDEMGQPVALSAARRRELSVSAALELSLPSYGAALCSSDIQLTMRELGNSTAQQPQQQVKSCTWSFDAELTSQCKRRGELDQSSSSTGNSSSHEPLDTISGMHATIALRLYDTRCSSDLNIKSAVTSAGLQDHDEVLTSEFHDAFERFCVNSAWLDTSTLVLALRSERIRLVDAAAAERTSIRAESASALSSMCSRDFEIRAPSASRASTVSTSVVVPTVVTTATPTVECQPQCRAVTIHENYGDAMGSHIWDASILLAFALLATGCSSRLAASRGMLELGAGCGLFAAVYAALRGFADQDGGETSDDDALRPASHMVLTERADSIELLTANVHCSIVGSSADGLAVAVVPLVWGAPLTIDGVAPPRIDTIFAADVLYSWSAHEPLLRSLDAIIAQQQQPSHHSANEASLRVIIAHKHRGKATSALLESVLRGDSYGVCRAHASHPMSESATDSADSQGDSSSSVCAWQRWRITRIARLGAIDLLELTPRHTCPSCSSE